MAAFLGVSAATAFATPLEERGIGNARERGIYVDPAMEALMADAPVGSCANDPTLKDCMKIAAVVYAPEFFGIPSDLPAPRSASTRTDATGILANAVAFNCHLRVIDRPTPYKAADYAQMDAQHQCLDAVSDFDIYLSLRKYYDDRWVTMDGRWFDNQPWTWWSGSLRWLCRSPNPLRNWRAFAQAYVIYKGVMYGGQVHEDNYLYCG